MVAKRKANQHRVFVQGACLLLAILPQAGAFWGAKDAANIMDAELGKAEGVKCPSSALKSAAGSGATSLSRDAQHLHAALSLTRGGHGAKARACLGRLFKAGEGSAWAWGALGELLRLEGSSDASAVFAEAARAAGPVVPQTYYDILGPFSVGKMEYDGDPIAAPIHGGVEHARGGGAKRFPSEYAEGGFVTWQSHAASALSGLAVDVSFPHVPWNKHVQLTNSMPILEWQSWAAADFLVTSSVSVRIACAGVHSFRLTVLGSRFTQATSTARASCGQRCASRLAFTPSSPR